jgi:nucleoside-diphosphate-sugar epimerase
MDVENNERDLLNPALKGTLGVLESIHKNAPTVKRVVITSSFASIIDMDKGLRPGYTVRNPGFFSPLSPSHSE